MEQQEKKTIYLDNLQQFKDNCDKTYIQDAPADNKNYVRNNGEWVEFTSSNQGLTNTSFHSLLKNTVTEDTIDDILNDDYLRDIVFNSSICIREILQNQTILDKVTDFVFPSLYSSTKLYNALLQTPAFFKRLADNNIKLTLDMTLVAFSSYDVMYFLLEDGLNNGKYHNYATNYNSYQTSNYQTTSLGYFYGSLPYNYIIMNEPDKFFKRYQVKLSYNKSTINQVNGKPKYFVYEKDIILESWADLNENYDLNNTKTVYRLTRVKIENKGSGQSGKAVYYKVLQGYDNKELFNTYEYCPYDSAVNDDCLLTFGGIKANTFFDNQKEYDDWYWITLTFEKYNVAKYKLIKNKYGLNELTSDDTATVVLQNDIDNFEIVASEETIEKLNKLGIDIYENTRNARIAEQEKAIDIVKQETQTE